MTIDLCMKISLTDAKIDSEKAGHPSEKQRPGKKCQETKPSINWKFSLGIHPNKELLLT